MKHHLHQLVDLEKLAAFLKTTKFPASEDELEKQAKTAEVDKNVVEFLEAIDEKIVFKSAQEVIDQAEKVNLLRQEESDSPPEQFTIDEY